MMIFPSSRRSLFCLLLGTLGLVDATYFSLWTPWDPSSTDSTRMRSRTCLPQSPFQECSQSHFFEQFDNCPSACTPDPSSQSSTGCQGMCADANNTVTFDCGVSGCTFSIKYMCVDLASCPASWTTWNDLTPCGVCGISTQVRQRECRDVNTAALSTACPGAAGVDNQNQTVICTNTEPCPVYTQWSDMGSCSSTCGGGLQNRTRTCVDNSGPTTGCTGPAMDMLPCETQECPGYSPWSNGTCSSACAEGNFTRTRNCTYLGVLSTLCPGAMADGTQSETLPCNNTGECGNWASWTDGPCSLTCGGGYLTRTRNCSLNMMVSTTCEGGNGSSSQEEMTSCNNVTCPYFGSWTTMGPCSAPCDGGVQNYTRECMLNGSVTTGCSGNSSKQEPCNTEVCNYTAWFDIGSCSALCDGGSKMQQRNCTTIGCTAIEFQNVTCNTQACNCSAWTNVGVCDQACDGGNVTQNRTCVTPSQEVAETQVVNCNTQTCNFTAWYDVIMCDVLCDGGSKTQQRNCTTIGCTAIETQMVQCNTQACNCSAWTNVGVCDQACDGGNVTQNRTCATPSQEVVEERVASCNTQACTYGPWVDTSSCSVTCGGGNNSQSQQCTVTGCTKQNTRTVECNTQPCILVGGGNFTWLIILATLVGAALLALLVYLLVPLCCGAGASVTVNTTAALVIESLQVASLGDIVWFGRPRLEPKPSPGMFRGNKTPAKDDIPMVRIDDAAATDAAPETSGNVSANNAIGDSATFEGEVNMATLNQWITNQQIALQNNSDISVDQSHNVTSNNSSASANQKDFYWVHSRSMSGSRPRSTLVSMARRVSGMDENNYREMK